MDLSESEHSDALADRHLPRSVCEADDRAQGRSRAHAGTGSQHDLRITHMDALLDDLAHEDISPEADAESWARRALAEDEYPSSSSSPEAGAAELLDGDIEQQKSYEAAKAVLLGHYKSLREALASPDFAGASLACAKEIHMALVGTPELVDSMTKAAGDWEHSEAVAAFGDLDRSCMDALEKRFMALESYADASALQMPASLKAAYRWCFAKAPYEDRRWWAYVWQHKVYKDLLRRAQAAKMNVVGGSHLFHIACYIFGDGAYCLRAVRNGVLSGISEPPPLGRHPSCPRLVERVLFRFCARLRVLNIPVYKSSVINYLKRLISGTEASLKFAKIDKDSGEPITCADGFGVEWDEDKLHHWWNRRFVGDRKAVQTHPAPTYN